MPQPGGLRRPLRWTVHPHLRGPLLHLVERPGVVDLRRPWPLARDGGNQLAGDERGQVVGVLDRIAGSVRR
jgi:hypothetical protein